MKIKIVSTLTCAYPWGGSEESWLLFASKALEAGHTVELGVNRSTANAPKVRGLPKARLGIRPHGDLFGVRKILAQRGLYTRFSSFFSGNYDVLLVSLGGIGDCLWMPDLLRELKRTEGTVFYSVQANAEGIIDNEDQRETLRGLFSKAAGVFFFSRQNLRLAQRQLGDPLPRAILVNNPLLEKIAPLPWPEAASPLRFATVGRLDLQDKQQDILLEAFSDPVWRDRDWELSFFGKGKDRTHLERLIAYYGLGSRAGFGGFVDGMAGIWRDRHAHILPSRREGMSLALIESMACGRPAIVTRAGGSAELVSDEVNGFVSPGMDAEALHGTLERAWTRRSDFAAMGLLARKAVEPICAEDHGETLLRAIVERTRRAVP